MMDLHDSHVANEKRRHAKPKTREDWLNQFIGRARPYFKKAGVPLPKQVRASIGFPSKGKKSKVIGECWASEASDDRHVEIFLRPSIQSDTSRIADVLTHELCHAALGWGVGHSKPFKLLATSLGLTGKMTATVAGPGWHSWADPIIKKLGPLPGANLGDQHLYGGKKKQTTRMIKLVCTGCDWTCRTSRAHIHPDMTCPIEDCFGYLEE